MAMFACAVVTNPAGTSWTLKALQRCRAAPEESPPQPIDWHVLDSINLLQLSPVDLAQQMTLLDTELLTKITVDELSSPKNWTNPSKSKTPAINVAAMVERFNAISNWVQTEILHKEDVRGRCRVMRHFLLVYREMIALNNYHAALGIASAFNTPAIARLHITNEVCLSYFFLPSLSLSLALPPQYLQKKVLSKKEKALFAEMNALTDSSNNWKRLRSAMESATPPGVPHLGVFLSDLLFLDEGNADSVNGLVNFSKKRLQAKIILRLHAFIRRPHVFSTVVQIRAWLQGLDIMSADDLFDLSKQVEPSASTSSSPTVSTNTTAQTFT